MIDFAKEMYSVEKPLGNKSTTDKSLLRLLKSPAIMAFGISTTFPPQHSNDLCHRITLLLQEKKAGFIFNIINEGIVAIADKILEYKCTSTKHHSTLFELFSVWNCTDFCEKNVSTELKIRNRP